MLRQKILYRRKLAITEPYPLSATIRPRPGLQIVNSLFPLKLSVTYVTKIKWE